jgi:hypothetical protein
MRTRLTPFKVFIKPTICLFLVDFKVQHFCGYKVLLDILGKIMLRISYFMVRYLTSTTWWSFDYLQEKEWINDVSLRQVLLFGMLDILQLLYHLIQYSHTCILSHIYVNVTFNLDCCYDILQHLLRICLSTKASVTFQTTHHPTSTTCRNILLLQANKQNIFCL